MIVECFNAVVNDAGSTRNRKALFGFHFGREAMAIPTKAAGNFVAAHGLVAGNHVFDVTS